MKLQQNCKTLAITPFKEKKNNNINFIYIRYVEVADRIMMRCLSSKNAINIKNLANNERGIQLIPKKLKIGISNVNKRKSHLSYCVKASSLNRAICHSKCFSPMTTLVLNMQLKNQPSKPLAKKQAFYTRNNCVQSNQSIEVEED